MSSGNPIHSITELLSVKCSEVMLPSVVMLPCQGETFPIGAGWFVASDPIGWYSVNMDQLQIFNIGYKEFYNNGFLILINQI